MTMTLETVRDGLRNNARDLARLGTMPMLAGHLALMADAIDAHITKPAQCQHDWAEGYGVPAYCNHCGVARDTQPAQSVDVDAIREVIGDLREWGETDEQLAKRAEWLTAALQEKGNG